MIGLLKEQYVHWSHPVHKWDQWQVLLDKMERNALHSMQSENGLHIRQYEHSAFNKSKKQIGHIETIIPFPSKFTVCVCVCLLESSQLKKLEYKKTNQERDTLRGIYKQVSEICFFH